ncbi:MAG: cupin domain-containing protein [Deltaproteobacteria bacterium]|nr:MAG: cupin domain-containing protein [Deltaproteobacteria bacterium]
MQESKVEVQRWSGPKDVNEQTLRSIYTEEGLAPYCWSNAPGDVYNTHTHSYHKVIYVVRGSITFGLPDTGEHLTLHAGDRLNLPADVSHNAVVGTEGVVCLEAHR